MVKGEGPSALLLTAVIVFYNMCSIEKILCVPCEIGSYQVNGGNDCEFCHAGSFSSSAGATSCNLCAAGQYSSEDGASSCHLCEPETFSRNIRDTSGKE
jgi:hypothetical protein